MGESRQQLSADLVTAGKVLFDTAEPAFLQEIGAGASDEVLDEFVDRLFAGG